MIKKLYELTAEYAALQDQVESGEIPPEAIIDTIDGLTGTIEEKGLNVTKVITDLDAQADAIKAEEKRLSSRRKAIENQAQSLREYLKSNMDRCGIQKISSPLWTITLADSTPMVQVTDESAIPEFYWRETVERTIDKKTIAEAIKAGNDVPGATLVASKRLLIK